jgi:hypothetical protein
MLCLIAPLPNAGSPEASVEAVFQVGQVLGMKMVEAKHRCQFLPVAPKSTETAADRLLWITRNFFSNCYPDVTQRDFPSRLVQKENPPSH